MFWIKTIAFPDAVGKLRQVYDRIVGPTGALDNILEVHSLRPHSLEGHMALYKNVLHHRSNTLPKWFLETIGVYVSLLNRCSYCVDHHYAGLERLLEDPERSATLRRALEAERFGDVLEPRYVTALVYAKKLTLDPASVDEAAVRGMRDAGLDDGEILEVNQVVAYFAYANRTVQGLGVTTEGDVLGLSPSDSRDEGSWAHR